MAMLTLFSLTATCIHYLTEIHLNHVCQMPSLVQLCNAKVGGGVVVVYSPEVVYCLLKLIPFQVGGGE